MLITTKLPKFQGVVLAGFFFFLFSYLVVNRLLQPGCEQEYLRFEKLGSRVTPGDPSESIIMARNESEASSGKP